MSKEQPKPRYRVSFLTPEQLNEKRRRQVKGWFFMINEEIGKHTFISKLS